MTVRARIIGSGGYLPGAPVTNDELAKRVETSDEWIVQRTGIRQRHIAEQGVRTSDLGVRAARAAIEHARIEADEIDTIILATTTPDLIFPSTAVRIQAALGIAGSAAFDLQAVCAGFIYALSVAQAMIASGQSRTLLLVGAETYSRILDWSDRRTCVLFGDGAGAVVLRAHENQGTTKDIGVLATHLEADGRLEDILYVAGGLHSPENKNVVKMRGQEVFKHAVHKLSQAAEVVIEKAGVTPQDIDWLVPHQANLRIIQAAADRLGVPMEKVILTVDRHANTSAASVPLALNEGMRDGRLKPGDLILLEALGGGLTWGAVVCRL